MNSNEDLIEIFREFFDGNINDGFMDVMFSKKYGYIIMNDYIEENHGFHDTYVCKPLYVYEIY